MNIKSFHKLLELDFKRIHIKNFFFYGLVFIASFLTGMSVLIIYFNQLFIEMNIVKLFFVVFTFSFPIYIINLIIFYYTNNNDIKLYDELEKTSKKLVNKSRNISEEAKIRKKQIDTINKLLNLIKEEKKDMVEENNDEIKYSDVVEEYNKVYSNQYKIMVDTLELEIENIKTSKNIEFYKIEINKNWRKNVFLATSLYLTLFIITLIISFNDSFELFLSRFMILDLLFFINLFIHKLSFLDKKFKEKGNIKYIGYYVVYITLNIINVVYIFNIEKFINYFTNYFNL